VRGPEERQAHIIPLDMLGAVDAMLGSSLFYYWESPLGS